MNKKLQINYTNVFQSGKLLKMGVPAWSADCTQEKEAGGSVWHHKWIKHEWDEHYDAKDYQKFLDREKDTIPCWSVGRLIEIINICSTTPFPNKITITRRNVDLSIIETLIDRLEELANYYSLDFSKLEE